MSLDDFLAQLKSADKVEFEETMAIIDQNFHYTPAAFSNGSGSTSVHNPAGQNEGSCKIFAFGKVLHLAEEETLYCFGRFYQDVLKTPEGNDHGNIRNFIKDGWSGIKFESEALTRK